MPTEKLAFYDWMTRKTEHIGKTLPADQAINAVSEMLAQMFTEDGEIQPERGREIVKAAGNTLEGLAKYLKEVEPFYARLETAFNTPFPASQALLTDLQKEIDSHPNLLVRSFLPALLKVNTKEIRVIVRSAMLRAAYAQWQDGAAGLAKVADPAGTGLFEYSRVVVDGVDRGYKFQSALKTRGIDEVLIFVEKAGPAFYLDGPKAGQKKP